MEQLARARPLLHTVIPALRYLAEHSSRRDVPCLQDFYEKECWAHHPKPHQEYMDFRKKQARRRGGGLGRGLASGAASSTASSVEQGREARRHLLMYG